MVEQAIRPMVEAIAAKAPYGWTEAVLHSRAGRGGSSVTGGYTVRGEYRNTGMPHPYEELMALGETLRTDRGWDPVSLELRCRPSGEYRLVVFHDAVTWMTGGGSGFHVVLDGDYRLPQPGRHQQPGTAAPAGAPEPAAARFHTYLQRRAEILGHPEELPPPATPAALDDAERRLGRRLPADLRARGPSMSRTRSPPSWAGIWNCWTRAHTRRTATTSACCRPPAIPPPSASSARSPTRSRPPSRRSTSTTPPASSTSPRSPPPPHLRLLHLNRSTAADLTPVRELPVESLRLTLADGDLTPLAGHRHLTSLDLNTTAPVDLTPLRTTHQLRGLDLSGAEVPEPGALADLPDLRYLALTGRQWTALLDEGKVPPTLAAARLADADATFDDALAWAARLGLDTDDALRVTGTLKTADGDEGGSGLRS
ncbi:hypothetical protein [Streptomyces sp. NPDC059008]|uniref:hypothetical protein n=1 Tax=Streptomyces sp. NPDC059008 TaxID=3346693 RepID=UPI0036C42944